MEPKNQRPNAPWSTATASGSWSPQIIEETLLTGTSESQGRLIDTDEVGSIKNVKKTFSRPAAPGETSKTILFGVIGDTAYEANKTFSLVLSGASSNATIATANGTAAARLAAFAVIAADSTTTPTKRR